MINRADAVMVDIRSSGTFCALDVCSLARDAAQTVEVSVHGAVKVASAV